MGGESILVDGYGAAEALRASDPEAFEILTAQPIDFRFHDEGCDIRSRAPAIALDAEGRVERVRFTNWLRAALDVPETAMAATYRARLAPWRPLRDPRFRLPLTLSAGATTALDNHPRT